MNTHLLSKSSFIRGIQCDKHIYLYKFHYDEMDEISEMQKAIFKRGIDIGKLAQQIFPGGIDLSPESHSDYEEALNNTKEYLNNKQRVIYEAAFQAEEVLSVADILLNTNDGLKIYEVKSSSSVTGVYLIDAALQYWVITKANYKVIDFSIIYINNQYVREGSLDLHQLFRIESVFDKIISKQSWIEKNINRLKTVLRQNQIPQIDIGEHCYSPYICGFYNYCRRHIPENSVFDLSGVHLTNKYEMYRSGIISMEELSDEIHLPRSAKIQVDVFKNGKELVDIEGIRNFLEEIHYPIYFMDFETFQPAIPLFDNSKPYMQIPFQYSLHYLERKGAELKHFEFLADAGDDPRIPFIENLLRDVK